MTAVELSSWLLYNYDFCAEYCGDDVYNVFICGVCYSGNCPHEVAHTMVKISIDMLECGTMNFC